MTKASISENLVKHLVEIEEGKKKLLEKYFLGPLKERNEIEQLIDDYVKQIEQLIKNAGESGSHYANNNVPFVTIDSEVEVQDLSNHEVFKYRIVNPLYSNVRKGDISYLSPVGKSLLLKKVGEEVKVDAPGGVFRYKIKSIRLQGMQNEKEQYSQ